MNYKFEVVNEKGLTTQELIRPSMVIDVENVFMLGSGELEDMRQYFKNVNLLYNDGIIDESKFILYEIPRNQIEVDRAFKDTNYAIEKYLEVKYKDKKETTISFLINARDNLDIAKENDRFDKHLCQEQIENINKVLNYLENGF